MKCVDFVSKKGIRREHYFFRERYKGQSLLHRTVIWDESGVVFRMQSVKIDPGAPSTFFARPNRKSMKTMLLFLGLVRLENQWSLCITACKNVNAKRY